ncbi:MAG: replication initiator protein A [Staphylococcus sp.]|uniref:replication initiator protein A n=1 Tax=Staphylococcus sp. TaxID=29387 RepID=UPI0017D29C60|nr:replication initiator protein A [Staphylococcus sp.]NWN86767.1 replication initiator protein A [Staphylococcus sp.]
MFDNILVPKALMFDEQYRFLSDSAKVLYSLILTQFMEGLNSNHKISKCDANGEAYVNVNKQNLFDFLNLDLFLFNKKLRELVHNDLLIIDGQEGDILKTRIFLLGNN